jgi:hypothetical protein
VEIGSYVAAAGSVSCYAPHTLADSTVYALKVEAWDDVILAYIDDVPKVAWRLATAFQTETHHGVYARNYLEGGVGADVATWDDFEINEYDGPGGGGGTGITDTFTGDDNTDISAHDPDADGPGGGWFTQWQGTSLPYLLESNRCRAYGFTANGQHSWAFIETGIADGTFQVDMASYVNSYRRSYPYLIFRSSAVNSAANFWFVRTEANNNIVRLFEVNGGGWTERGNWSGTINSGQLYEIRVVTSGNSIQVYVEGTLRISYSSSFNATATVAGIGAYVSHYTSLTFPLFDDFEVS